MSADDVATFRTGPAPLLNPARWYLAVVLLAIDFPAGCRDSGRYECTGALRAADPALHLGAAVQRAVFVAAIATVLTVAGLYMSRRT